MTRAATACAALFLGLVLSSTAGAQPAAHVLVIVGLGGDLENAERFHRWATTLVDAARGRYALPAESVIYLGEDPGRDPGRISGRSTREEIGAAVTRLAGRARPGDVVLVVLIGHGASATGTARFNLPGPDVTAADFARLLDRLTRQAVVFVNTASASGSFVAAASRQGRTIVTATKTDGEKNQTRFGEYFTAAFGETGGEADADKDGRVSVLEAFLWARARTADSYSRDGQLLTEHAVLDDNGDGAAADTAGQPGSDGALARTLFLSAGTRTGSSADGGDPALRALVAQRDAAEAKVTALTAAKNEIEPERYAQDLERLLVELARVSRALRERQRDR